MSPSSVSAAPAFRPLHRGRRWAGAGLCLVLSACGGGASGPDAAASAPLPPVPAARLVVSPAALTFSGQAVGRASLPQDVVLTNAGDAPAALQGMALDGSGSAAFRFSHDCPPALAAGAACSLQLVFAPQEAAGQGARLLIRSDAAGASTELALTGNPVPAAWDQADWDANLWN